MIKLQLSNTKQYLSAGKLEGWDAIKLFPGGSFPAS
jgi:hypothetical protein